MAKTSLQKHTAVARLPGVSYRLSCTVWQLALVLSYLRVLFKLNPFIFSFVMLSRRHIRQSWYL